MTKQPAQADGSIHEDQLLDFLVNALTGAFGVSIAGNGAITPEDIYEVLVHLRTNFDLDTVSAVGNTLLQGLTASTTAKPSEELPHSMPTRHCTPA